MTRLGFTKQDEFNGHVLLATDVNRPILQSFIFAYAQNSSEIAIGYIEKLHEDMKRMPRVNTLRPKMIYTPLL